jgi:hypothetical protein
LGGHVVGEDFEGAGAGLVDVDEARGRGLADAGGVREVGDCCCDFLGVVAPDEVGDDLDFGCSGAGAMLAVGSLSS